MERFNIESYINSLDENIEHIDVSNKNIKYIPDLSRFKNLKELYCHKNYLTSLPTLNENLETLYCYENNLIFLPVLNKNLKTLYCDNNLLTRLPILNENLVCLSCGINKLTYLPSLNEKLKYIFFDNNIVHEIINNNSYIMNYNYITIIKEKIKILNNFRYLYYCLKFKKQFRDWLWKKIREPKIIKKYHPCHLIKNLNIDTDLDNFLNNW
jgi:Leucine-rich repeat (LRR) protein